MTRERFFDGKKLKAADFTVEQNYQRRNDQNKEETKMPVQRERPYPKNNFIVEIDGVALASFMECTGLKSVTEVIEYREGAEKVNTVRKLAGLTKYSNIVLKRGVGGSMDLYQWRKAVIDGDIQRRDFVIILHNEKREEVCRWVVKNAWPCGMTGPDLNAGESGVAIEEFEICHEGYDLA